MAKFGVREICDVVLKAKATQMVGNKKFYKNEPVIYFDTLKTSSMEGAATTVYAQGGAGNSRLVAWEGERTVTFTMEDALISPEGFMILSGAGLIDATEGKPIYQHMTETIDASAVDTKSENAYKITLSEIPYLGTTTAAGENEDFAYVMFMKDGEIISEPFIPAHGTDDATREKLNDTIIEVKSIEEEYQATLPKVGDFDSVLVDYYVKRTGGAQQIEITADKFGGNYYLEASTLFRTTDGVDMPAEFIIPNCKIQSNFTFSMASSGDPSTFTFTLDAFPDYTRFDHTKKVLATIQMIDTTSTSETDYRTATKYTSPAASNPSGGSQSTPHA